ncbi:hydroxyacid dehydrogenase [Hamadaea sp. NPDC050747]|uniref:hydroxyacid dehydrogenase n=1 Tax=Hamadaea sp. NPDC050747 TaxID=3155789 RepID=UPI003404FE80
MTRRPVTALVMSTSTAPDLFDPPRLDRLHALAQLDRPEPLTEVVSAANRARLREVEVMITGWGSPVLTSDVLDAAPRLRAVLHAAGSVKHHLTDASCWDRGILVTSAADANAVPVAEFTLAAILHSGKRVSAFVEAYRRRSSDSTWRDGVPEASNYRRTVGIVGLSRIGRRVARLLQSFDFTVLAHDPYADPADAEALGTVLLPLPDLVRRSDILTLHAPSLPETRNLLDRETLALLPDHATVINTARGSLIDTDALTAECVRGRLNAVLDVTEPEPLPLDSPLFGLPNVQLTPHIAGAMGAEVHRLADAALDELDRYARGLPPACPVHLRDLARMA